jgi:hypothetical protein
VSEPREVIYTAEDMVADEAEERAHPAHDWTLPDMAQAHRALTEDNVEDDEYDDGKVLIAGVLYDRETGEVADPQ